MWRIYKVFNSACNITKRSISEKFKYLEYEEETALKTIQENQKHYLNDFTTQFKYYLSSKSQKPKVQVTTTVSNRKNEEIKSPTVRLVMEDGTHSVISIESALEMAKNKSLDLVEVSSGSQPPVTKLMDYNKYVAHKKEVEKEIAKKEREKQKKENIKEVRITPRITENDLKQKMKKIEEFLSKNQKVSLVVLSQSSFDKQLSNDATSYIINKFTEKYKLKTESIRGKIGTKTTVLIPQLVETS